MTGRGISHRPFLALLLASIAGCWIGYRYTPVRVE